MIMQLYDLKSINIGTVKKNKSVKGLRVMEDCYFLLILKYEFK